MNALAPVIVLLLIAGSIGVLATAGQMWAAGGTSEDLVGHWRTRQRAPEPPPAVPSNFRSLIHGEAIGWQRVEQWELLLMRLDQLEAELGGVPTGEAPDFYSETWLDQRIARIENIAGPLPAPLRHAPTRTPSRLPWKK